eukprot:CAMPEP_0183799218 /NCGR_PEP_ID=MMETSP0803_2-20130417/21008_1 /TAXON_ID=195967 /ORGANISM="Crustomastix stigmata, Strain CCMP3273" /LENGTH=144 /DNA_ID=CAMNT_0026043915 /DNA_START=84 /DNA_END=514 /DNA_ORIENTATION=+
MRSTSRLPMRMPNALEARAQLVRVQRAAAVGVEEAEALLHALALLLGELWAHGVAVLAHPARDLAHEHGLTQAGAAAGARGGGGALRLATLLYARDPGGGGGEAAAGEPVARALEGLALAALYELLQRLGAREGRAALGEGALQ